MDTNVHNSDESGKGETQAQAAFTPGPYDVGEFDGGWIGIYASPDDTIVGRAESEDVGEDATVANANLFAASTDLLAVAKSWAEYFASLDRDAEPGDPLDEARRNFHGPRVAATLAAIAKAEGRTS